MRNRRSALLSRTHFDSDRCKRSRRTVEAAGRNAESDVSQAGNNRSAGRINGFDCDYGRKNAREKGVERAALVGVVAVVITVMMSSPGAALMMHLPMLDVGGDRVGEGSRARQRRRNHACKLGDQEQGDQYMDEAT
jgi:hypothetical protein